MKYSIKKQLLAVFLGLIAMIVLLVIIINSSFLETYYVSDKVEKMVDIYSSIDEALEESVLNDEEVQEDLIAKSERANISVAVMNRNRSYFLRNRDRAVRCPYSYLDI